MFSFLNYEDSKFFLLEQKHLFFPESILPLSVTISCAEPRHKRIFASIGAKGQHSAFLKVSEKLRLKNLET
jgi:hypothetical protein